MLRNSVHEIQLYFFDLLFPNYIDEILYSRYSICMGQREFMKKSKYESHIN